MLEKLPDAVGHALRHRRAGLDKITFNRIDLRAGTAALEVTSTAFGDHAPMPPRFTADGDAVSPPIAWRGVPAGATSVLLIVEDADAPTPQPLVHAIAVDLPPEDGGLPEGALGDTDPQPDGIDVKTGRNSTLQRRWLPPDPPPGHGAHRYAFQVFALAGEGRFSDAPGRDEVQRALVERAIASGLLTGTYSRDEAVRADDGPLGATAGPA